MKKRVWTVLLAILLLTGCWDRKELNEYGIVLGIAIDQDPSGKGVILSCQIIRPAAVKQQFAIEQAPVEIVTTKGRTLGEAAKNILKEVDREVSFSHNRIIVIDEELAKKGINPILDFFLRSNRASHLSWLVIARNTKAREILGTKHGIETIQAAYLNSVIKLKKLHSESNIPDIVEFSQKTFTNESNPVVGVMQLEREPAYPVELEKSKSAMQINASGSAAFKKDRLVGYFDARETRGLNWVTGKVNKGVFQVLSPVEEKKYISIRTQGASSRIRPEIKGRKISFTIEVKAEGVIYEQEDGSDLFTKLFLFEQVEKDYKRTIEKEITAAVNKAQKEFRSDVFGFGYALHRAYPKEWKQIKNHWEEIFPKVGYKLHVNAEIRRTGLLRKPVNAN